ncbi:MAG: CotH kinase family protein [Myxococcota bacterium]
MLTWWVACVGGTPEEGERIVVVTGTEDAGDAPGGGDDGDPDPSDDTGEPALGPWGWDPRARGAFLYEPGVVHEFWLELPEASIDALWADPYAPAWAEFTWEGETYAVSVHLKGRYSFRDLGGKAAFKVDFHEYDDAGSFHGVKRLTLNNMVQDGSMLAEHGSYYVSRAAGLPAPRHGYANVYVNGELYGLYGIVETPDEQFLDDHFADDDGNLYSGGYGGDVESGNARYFDLEEASPVVEPYTDLEALCETVAAVEDDAFWEALDQYFYRDEVLGMWAVEIVSGQDDGYLTWANNYLLYNDIGVNRWALLPWGTDQAFTAYLEIGNGYHGHLADRCVKHSTCKEPLRARVAEVVAAWEAADVPGYLAYVAGVIHEACEADPRAELSCERNQQELLDFVRVRATEVREDL